MILATEDKVYTIITSVYKVKDPFRLSKLYHASRFASRFELANQIQLFSIQYIEFKQF